jgi:hypothetical protein
LMRLTNNIKLGTDMGSNLQLVSSLTNTSLVPTKKDETIMKNKFKQSHGGRENYITIKYKKDRTNDCSIRAIAHFLDMDYKHIRNRIFNLASELWRMPNDDLVIETFLNDRNFKKQSPLKSRGNKKYKIGNFPLVGTYLIRCSRHWTCLKDGVVLDTWDCREWKAQSFYKIEGGK